LKLWDYDTGMTTHVGTGHSGAITCAALSPCSTFAVSVGTEGAIMIWGMPEEAMERMADDSILEGAEVK